MSTQDPNALRARSPYDMGGGGMGITMPQSTPLAYMPQQSGMQMKLNVPKDDAPAALAWQGSNQALSTIGNTIIAGLNSSLQGKAIEAQSSVMKAYYGTQEKIAGFQKQVAMRQLDVQERAVLTQSQMHRNQLAYEEKVTRLEGSTQAKLARIHEDGKTARARTMTMTDAFKSSREDWFYGRC